MAEKQLIGLSSEDKNLIITTVHTMKTPKINIKLSNGQIVHIYNPALEKDFVPPGEGQVGTTVKGSFIDKLINFGDDISRWFMNASPIVAMPTDAPLPPGWTEKDREDYNSGKTGTPGTHKAPDWRPGNPNSDINDWLRYLKYIGIGLLVVVGIGGLGATFWVVNEGRNALHR